MTEAEVIELVGHVNLRWSRQKLKAEVVPIWVEDLREIEKDAAHAAVVRIARRGHDFPPSSGQIYKEVKAAESVPAPSFDDVQLWLSRNVNLLPYGGTDRDTTEAIENLTRAGAHEAICRFVQQQGLYAVRMIPDPRLQPLDPNQKADRRDKARQYEQRTLPDWEKDPTPGLALARVRSQHLGDGGGGTELRKIDGVRALGQGKQAN